MATKATFDFTVSPGTKVRTLNGSVVQLAMQALRLATRINAQDPEALRLGAIVERTTRAILVDGSAGAIRVSGAGNFHRELAAILAHAALACVASRRGLPTPAIVSLAWDRAHQQPELGPAPGWPTDWNLAALGADDEDKRAASAAMGSYLSHLATIAGASSVEARKVPMALLGVLPPVQAPTAPAPPVQAPTAPAPSDAAPTDANTAKRGKGRPKGSRNKAGGVPVEALATDATPVADGQAPTAPTSDAPPSDDTVRF